MRRSPSPWSRRSWDASISAAGFDLLAPRQLDLVTEAITAYGGYRGSLADAVPSWPLGLPGWRDDWLALALDTGGRTLLALWRRGGTDPVREIPVPAGTSDVVPVFPTAAPGEAVLDRTATASRVVLPAAPAARLLLLPRAASPLS